MKFIVKIICILAVAGCDAPSEGAQDILLDEAGISSSRSGVAASDIRALAQAYHEAGLFEGVLGVATLDEVVFEGGFGAANLVVEQLYSPQTKVRLASVSKPFTAALVMRLHEREQLQLEQSVGELLPEYAEYPASAVRVSELLSHRSGIPNYQYTEPYETLQTRALLSGLSVVEISTSDMVSTFIERELIFSPGEQYSYSNSNYVLLQAIVERITDQSFEDVLQSEVFDPVGMTHSGVIGYRSVVESLAEGYVVGLEGYSEPLQGQFIGAIAPGGVYSTSSDMLLWFQTLFSGDYFEHAETLELMTTARGRAYSQESSIGYGLFIASLSDAESSTTMIGHDGWGPPFTANLQYVPELQLVIFAADGVSALGGGTYGETVRLTEDIIRIARGGSVDFPVRPADQVLANLIQELGSQRAVELFLAQSEENGATSTTERELNGLGYLFLSRNDADTAIDVFRLNAALFPDSANAHDSLGEAYLSVDQVEDARAAYEIALSLSPGDGRLEEVLRSLQDVGDEL